MKCEDCGHPAEGVYFGRRLCEGCIEYIERAVAAAAPNRSDR